MKQCCRWSPKEKLTRENNKDVILCYFENNLTQKVKRKMMIEIWAGSKSRRYALRELKHIILKTKYHETQLHNITVNIHRKRQCRVNKKTMTEEKATLLSLRKQDWKKVTIKTEKINKLLKDFATNSIRPNNRIYVGINLVNDRIDIPQTNLKSFTKPEWEMKFDRQINKLQ